MCTHVPSFVCIHTVCANESTGHIYVCTVCLVHYMLHMYSTYVRMPQRAQCHDILLSAYIFTFICSTPCMVVQVCIQSCGHEVVV